jgi:hypothetical protein
MSSDVSTALEQPLQYTVSEVTDGFHLEPSAIVLTASLMMLSPSRLLLRLFQESLEHEDCLLRSP